MQACLPPQRIQVEATQTKVHSTIVRSRDVSEEKLLDFGDVHGLLDGSVPTADLKQAALQRVPACHHSEENSHLVVPEARGTQGVQRIDKRDAERISVKRSLRRVKLYRAVSCSSDVGCVLRYPGHTEILASSSSSARPSHTFNKMSKILVKISSPCSPDPGPVPLFPTCLSSTVAPLPISSATLTGANTGCNFST